MSRLFGTDGIRGIYNEHPVTQKMAHKLGHAIVRFCENRKVNANIVIGRDTRGSGILLEYCLVSGILSAGGNAWIAGVFPTPGVAFLTRYLKAGAGIVLSASHNPYTYNGFKVFTNEGFKLSLDDESDMESLITEESLPFPPDIKGQVDVIKKAEDHYRSFLSGTLGGPIRDMKIVLDCANGATFRIAPALFKDLGLKPEVLFAKPDGENINLDCGSQHTETLSMRVIESGADAGLAFDGDGDRLIAVDERGVALTGDQIMTICAMLLKEKGEMGTGVVVSTVMSNMGLRAALKDLGIGHAAGPVGDRYVVEEMRRRNSLLGGEDSGHIIFLNHNTTGDGMLTALQLLHAVTFFNHPLSRLAGRMTIYPQTLINVPVKEKPDIAQVPALVRVIKDTEEQLGDDGRVLVRYSGTEPLCRIMVEGKTREQIGVYAKRIAEVVAERLNS